MDHLTRVVLAAQAAGMSYGKYVALQRELGAATAPPAPQKAAEQSPARRTYKCQICGGPIPIDRRLGCKTCGPECQEINNRLNAQKRYRETTGYRPESNRKCEWCGEEYTPKRRAQRFCNDRCRRALDRAVRRGDTERPQLRPGMANRSYGTGECVICGKAFTKRNSRAITCSAECRKLYSGKKKE